MSIDKIKYIDCHSHPHDEKYIKEGVDVDKVLGDLLRDGGATIAIGTDFELSKQALELAQKHENLWCTIGVHPVDKGTLIPEGDNHQEIFDERFENLYLENKDKIVGVGECGLDYYRGEVTDDEKDRQKSLFKQQIEFALKYNLPLVIHGRPSKNSMDAYRDVLDILEECVGWQNPLSSRLYPGSRAPTPLVNRVLPPDSPVLKGHAHFFVGNLEIAKRFLSLGFLMSFDGPITFTKEYDEVIKFLPMENIMIETDSPYAAPMPYRGQINYPTFVKEVAKKIAELKSLTTDEVLEITKNNAIKLFKL